MKFYLQTGPEIASDLLRCFQETLDLRIKFKRKVYSIYLNKNSRRNTWMVHIIKVTATYASPVSLIMYLSLLAPI